MYYMWQYRVLYGIIIMSGILLYKCETLCVGARRALGRPMFVALRRQYLCQFYLK